MSALSSVRPPAAAATAVAASVASSATTNPILRIRFLPLIQLQRIATYLYAGLLPPVKRRDQERARRRTSKKNSNQEDTMRLVKIGLVATAVAAAVAFVGVGRPDFARGSAPPGRTVTVTGTGSVRVGAEPGRALGRRQQRRGQRTGRAGGKRRQGGERDRRAARRWRRQGRPADAADVTVSPRWDDRGRQDGFTAHSAVQVDVGNVTRAGAILDAAVAAGATETSGPTFDRSDRSQLYRERAEGGLRRRPRQGDDARAARPARASARHSGSRRRRRLRSPCRSPTGPGRRRRARRSSPARQRCRRR